MSTTIQRNASIMAALIGVITSLIAATILFTTGKVTSIKIGDLRIDAPQPTMSVAVTEEIENEINAIKNQIKSLTIIPKEAAVASEIQVIKVAVKNLEEQINIINKAIIQSPEKALSIPMLRKDVDALKLQNEHTAKSLEREIGSAYEIIKWVLGTIVLGILGISASVFVATREKKNA